MGRPDEWQLAARRRSSTIASGDAWNVFARDEKNGRIGDSFPTWW